MYKIKLNRERGGGECRTNESNKIRSEYKAFKKCKAFKKKLGEKSVKSSFKLTNNSSKSAIQQGLNVQY